MFIKSDRLENYVNLLDKTKIKKIICFDDYWKEQNFMIETQNAWALFQWSIVV